MFADAEIGKEAGTESPVSFLISDDLVKNVWRMRTSECLHWESSGTVTIF